MLLVAYHLAEGCGRKMRQKGGLEFMCWAQDFMVCFGGKRGARKGFQQGCGPIAGGHVSWSVGQSIL